MYKMKKDALFYTLALNSRWANFRIAYKAHPEGIELYAGTRFEARRLGKVRIN